MIEEQVSRELKGLWFKKNKKCKNKFVKNLFLHKLGIFGGSIQAVNTFLSIFYEKNNSNKIIHLYIF